MKQKIKEFLPDNKEDHERVKRLISKSAYRDFEKSIYEGWLIGMFGICLDESDPSDIKIWLKNQEKFEKFKNDFYGFEWLK